MTRRPFWWIALFGFLLTAAPREVPSAEPSTVPTSPQVDGDPDREAMGLAAKIDELIAARWQATGAEPAPTADDAEFIRRVYLDLAGKIPLAGEVREFLDDASPEKRRRLVDRLLEGPGYIVHFTNVWRALLLPEANSEFQIRALVPNFEAWLREHVAAGSGFDDIARDLLTTSLQTGEQQQTFNPYSQRSNVTPIAFYTAKQAKPENLAASAARVFLGVRVGCAQCHDHPFTEWKQEDFWRFAAFFAEIESQNQGRQFQIQPGRRKLTIPGTERLVEARYLDGTEPKWADDTGPRTTLVDWLTSPENPYFARASVNRIWAHLFGTGLVDPVDDFDPSNPPSHPELLDELARGFAAHEFDLKFLIRALTRSRAYQLTSAFTHASQTDPRLFARMQVKGLTAEQIFDSLVQATGYRQDRRNQFRFGYNPNSPRGQFLARFGDRSGGEADRETTILQALTMMNGGVIVSSTGLDTSLTLAAVAMAPFLDTTGRVEALFLASLSRKPTPEEAAKFVAYVDDGGTRGDSNVALADVFWALLNSAEFLSNH